MRMRFQEKQTRRGQTSFESTRKLSESCECPLIQAECSLPLRGIDNLIGKMVFLLYSRK